MAARTQLYLYAAFFVLYEVTVYLANDMIMPGMVNVIREFHTSIDHAATSLTYFIVGGCSLPLFLNAIIEKIGSRRVLLFGNGLFLIATLFISLTSDINQFLFARFFQGMGLGFIFIGYSTIHQLFDDITAIKVIAILGNISVMAPLIGPIIGGAITKDYNWRFVFILVGVMGAGSLYGLFKYMPEVIPDPAKASKDGFIKSYTKLLTNRLFLLGSLIGAVSGVVTIAWIGISPVIIFSTYKATFTHYVTYQIMVFSGSVISSILIQLIANNFKILQLIKFGSKLSLCGLILSFIFSIFGSKILCVLGLFIFTLGAGLYIGIINRITISTISAPTSTIAALSSLINAAFSCIGLELANALCYRTAYTFPALSLFNLLMGIGCFSLTRVFMNTIKDYNLR